MNQKVRVLRIMEYVGDREWIEKTLQTSYVPADGVKILGEYGTIKSCLIDKFPEIIGADISDKENLEELRQACKPRYESFRGE